MITAVIALCSRLTVVSHVPEYPLPKLLWRPNVNACPQSLNDLGIGHLHSRGTNRENPRAVCKSWGICSPVRLCVGAFATTHPPHPRSLVYLRFPWDPDATTARLRGDSFSGPEGAHPRWWDVDPHRGPAPSHEASAFPCGFWT